jgi:hypothetical protein
MSFDGALLNRGFWLYVWEIKTSRSCHLYVGRTGDSSSANAGSPFMRIGQHLDFRPNAKGSSLARCLRKAGVTPSECTFEMVAIGPIFPEQKDFSSHKLIRDILAALESKLAAELRARGYNVLGSHGRPAESDPDLYVQVLVHVSSRFPNTTAA